MPGRDRQRFQAQISTTHLSSLDGSSLSPGRRQAALSTAGFVMLQLGASCHSPTPYTGLPFLSFSLPNKQKQKAPSLADWGPGITGDGAERDAHPPRPTPATFKRSASPRQPLCLAEPRAHTQSSIWSPSPSSPRQLARTEQNALWF